MNKRVRFVDISGIKYPYVGIFHQVEDPHREGKTYPKKFWQVRVLGKSLLLTAPNYWPKNSNTVKTLIQGYLDGLVHGEPVK